MSVRENVYVAFGIKFPMEEIKQRLGIEPDELGEYESLQKYREERTDGKELRLFLEYEGREPFAFVGKVIAQVDLYDNVTPGFTYIPHPQRTGTDPELVQEFIDFGITLEEFVAKAGNCVFTIVT